MFVTERPINSFSFQWLILNKENEKDFEKLFNYGTLRKLTDVDKNELVDKHFPDKSKTIYNVYTGKKWTSEQKRWYLEDITDIVSTLPFNVEIKKISMLHFKK